LSLRIGKTSLLIVDEEKEGKKSLRWEVNVGSTLMKEKDRERQSKEGRPETNEEEEDETTIGLEGTRGLGERTGPQAKHTLIPQDARKDVYEEPSSVEARLPLFPNEHTLDCAPVAEEDEPFPEDGDLGDRAEGGGQVGEHEGRREGGEEEGERMAEERERTRRGEGDRGKRSGVKEGAGEDESWKDKEEGQ
jgi:hypothetical protein